MAGRFGLDMAAEPDCIRMKAVGRPFAIGSLYNYTEDVLISNFQLWDPQVSNQTVTNRENNATVHTMNNYLEPNILFDLDHHTAMSLTTGLVRPPCGRAWNYVVDSANFAVGPFGRSSSEVAVHCQSSSKKESVDLTVKQPEVICRLDGLIKNNATHVVVAVTYGLEAFCIFSHQKPQHDMLDGAKLFADKLLENSVRLDARNFQTSPEFQCILYSDLMESRHNGLSWKSQPITGQYEACWAVMNHQINKGIPIEVVLYPIRNLNAFKASIGKMPANQTDTSRYLMVRCQSLWDRLQQVRFQSDTLINESNLFKSSMTVRNWNLPAFYQKIQEFHLNFEKLLKILLQALSHWTVAIRQGKERSEDHMLQMMEAIENKSPLESNELMRWIEYHKEQIRTLETLKNLPGVDRLSGTKQVLDREVQNASYDWYAVVLHLPNLTGQPDRLVQDMNYYSESFKANKPPSWTGTKSTNNSLVNYKPFLQAGQEFSDWVTNYNSETANVHYVIFYDERTGQSPFIRLYRCGTNDSMVIDIPKAPGRVRIVEKRRGVLVLNWAAGETVNFVGYLLQYCNVTRPNDPWTSIRKHRQNEITINFLQPEESYVFRVATETLAGKSPFGPVSDEVIIDPICPPPMNIKTKLVTDSVIILTWDRYQDPQNQIRITSYSVDCWVDGRPTLIQRTTTSNEVTIEPLDRGTVYCIQIRAVCVDTTGTIFDGPSCPVLKVRTERDAERPAQIVRRASRRNLKIKSDITIYNLTLRKPQGISTPGVDHYVFGELTYLALAGKRRRRTVLMVGATGSGKTTLINAMVNYVLGVKWEDDFRFKLIDEQTDKSQAHSQTDLITTYDLYETKGSRLEYSLTVVDTPGFGDTRGIEKDNKIYDQIQDYFKGHHGIRQLEAVCFVVEASLPRLTETQQYIFDSILSIFGNDIKDNIRLMVTFADNDQPPVLAAIKEAGIPSPVDQKTKLPLHHKFSSSIFFTSNKKDRRTNEINRTYFDMSVESFDRFFGDLSQMETKSLARTTEVLEERKRLHVLVECLQMRTEMKMTRVNELEKIKKVLTDNREQMEANADFEFDVEFHVPKSIDITGTSQFTTNCQKCQMTCHFPCRQGDDKDKNKCSVMDPDGFCSICNCPWNAHYHQRYRYEVVKEIKRHSLASIRELYQGAADEALSNEKLVEKIQKEIDDDEKQLLDLMQATSPHIQRLDEIALRPHPMSTLAYIDLMIETERKENRPDIKNRISRLQKLRANAEFKKSVLEREKLPQVAQTTSTTDSVEKEMQQESNEKKPEIKKVYHEVKLAQLSEDEASSVTPDVTPKPVQQGQSDYDLAESLNQMTVTEKREKKEELSMEDPKSRKSLMKELAESAQKKSKQKKLHNK